jgi:hypothetical protein
VLLSLPAHGDLSSKLPGEPSKPEPSKPGEPSEPSKPMKPALQGRIVLRATPPAPSALKISDPQCPPQLDPSQVVDQEHGLGNAAIWVVDTESESRAPKNPVTLNFSRCAYQPHVQVAIMGQDLIAPDEEPPLHNPRAWPDSWRGSDTRGSLERIPGKPFSYRLEDTLTRVTCDYHRWESAYVWGLRTDQAAVSDEHGRFAIGGISPGMHTFVVWHEKLGARRFRFEVKPGMSKELVFEDGTELKEPKR